MAWTTPRTWVAAETVTAALGNTHWRDNLQFLYDVIGGVQDYGAQWTVNNRTFSVASRLFLYSSGSALGSLGYVQAANDTGAYIQFVGGAALANSRGYVGFAKHGTGTVTLFTSETADYFCVRGDSGLHLGISTDLYQTIIPSSGIIFGSITGSPNGYAFYLPAGLGASNQTIVSIISTYNAGASAANAWLQLTVGGSVSIGDPAIGFTVTGAASWTLGVDNSDNDTFKLAASSSFASNVILYVSTSGNVGFNGLDNATGGVKVIYIANATTIPTGTPSGGGILYSSTSGALHWLGGAGTDTPIAVA